MEQTVLVRELLPDGTASVVRVRESACSGDCHKCSGCGAARETIVLRAKNDIGAQVGDVVRLESASSPVLKAAAVLYVLPLLAFFAGYIVGENLWGRGILVSLLAFALGMLPVRLVDRSLAKKMQYTITAFVSKSTENERNRGQFH